jgi:hypothetical protein
VGLWWKREGGVDEWERAMGRMGLVCGMESGIGDDRTTGSMDGGRTPVGGCQFSMANGTESDMNGGLPSMVVLQLCVQNLTPMDQSRVLFPDAMAYQSRRRFSYRVAGMATCRSSGGR